MNRSRSFVAAEAIREYVSLNDWQIAETKKGIAEADCGDFFSDKEVERTVKKWTSRSG
jgi:RHH-type transcriptional regulator, rel operon repressor / antitoxin RelB